MSAFARAATMPTRLPVTPAVRSGMPTTGGAAGFSRPKPKSPRFFFSGGAAGGGLHSSTGGVLGSETRNDAERESGLAGLPHGSAEVDDVAAGAVQVLGAGGAAGAIQASFPGAGAGSDGGGDHARCVGVEAGGVPQGSSDVSAAAGSGAGGLVQRSADGMGSGGVPQWSDPAAGSGSDGAGPKMPERALRRSSSPGAGSASCGLIHSGSGAGASDLVDQPGMTSEIGTALSVGAAAAQSSAGAAWSGVIQSCVAGGTSAAGSDVKSGTGSGAGAGAHAFAGASYVGVSASNAGGAGSAGASGAYTCVLGVDRSNAGA